nr:hypothetical protein [Salmonella enterica]
MGQPTRYRHGAFDLLREVEDAGGQRIVCDYDGAARLTQLTRSGNQRWRLYYDAAGELAGGGGWAGGGGGFPPGGKGRGGGERGPGGSGLFYTSPSPRDGVPSRVPASACKKKKKQT